jgi:hypothetical protein
MDNDPKWILEMQLKTGRTKVARDISLQTEDGMDLRSITKDCLEDPELSPDKLTECPNCALVLRPEFFSKGCPNTHCMYKGKMKPFGEGSKIKKE